MTISTFFSLVRFQETLFALPWVFISALLTSQFLHRSISIKQATLFFLATFFARSAAMSFNRYFDRNIDRLNPRTRHRLLPAKKVSEKSVISFGVIGIIGFISTCFFLHPLCFQLSFGLALLIVSYPFFQTLLTSVSLCIGGDSVFYSDHGIIGN